MIKGEGNPAVGIFNGVALSAIIWTIIGMVVLR